MSTATSEQRHSDEHNLERFVKAQEQWDTYARAVKELRQGRKTTHWIWFVFPQIAGLGFSHNSRIYAIASLDEARAYLAHPVLGPRLLECAEIVASSQADTPEEMLGDIDTQKLQSSMTLFHLAAPEETVFERVLDRYFASQLDRATTEHL